MTLTLQIIAKDEVKDVARIIRDYIEYFDKIQIAYDDDCIADLGKHPKVELFKYEWIGDFAHKRNWLADQCTTDYYFTIDTDDTIIHPELIRDVAEKANRENFNIVYGYYLYGVDQDGNCCAAHWKERLIKNSKNLRWNKKIHENLVPVSLVGHTFDLDDRLLVKHNATHEDIVESQKRNLKFLVEEYEKDKDKTDPRTIAYLGRVFFGLGEFKKARFFLEKHIELSGWDEDRYLSWCQLADVHRLQKDYTQAIACGFEALAERPDYPDAYLALFWVYFDQEQWLKAIEWCEQGLKKPTPKTFIVTDPSSYTWRPAVALSYAYWNIGEFEKAMSLFNFAKNLAPSVPFIQQNEKIYKEALDRKLYIDHLLWIINFTKENNGSMEALTKSIPSNMWENQTISLLRNRYLEPEKWSNKSIVIYCGETPNSWCPDSTKGGIGGSEEAVIHMANEFTKLGYEVTVYNTCEKEGNYKGVNYLGSVRFNPRDEFNIVISWRTNIFAYQVQAKRKIVWLHDLPSSARLTEENCRFFDKIVVLSNYHKSLLPSFVPEEKIYVSTNGINPEDFLGIEGIKREPHRIIYASSYDRGIEIILNNWKEIRDAVPDAELHLYYGFNTYVSYIKKGLLRDDGWMAQMQRLLSQTGVFDHGRVGHNELAKEYAKASIFAYPCTYAGEINCIALTKAIACGCYPLTNDFAVLPERNTHGRVVKNEKFVASLIALLRHGDTKINNEGYIEQNSWKKVAEDWEQNIFPSDVEVEFKNRGQWFFDKLNPADKIVDIGSNDGHCFFDYPHKENITYVDIDEYDIPNFVQANAENLPFEDKKFDVACMFEILEHVDNPVKALSEARRVAKRTLVTVPYEYEWADDMEPFWTIKEKKRWHGDKFEEDMRKENHAKSFHNDNYEHLFHKTFYTPELLKDHLTQAGFEEIKIVKLRFGKWVWMSAECK